jgi:thiol-disulfide isomerase/thioredoxin
VLSETRTELSCYRRGVHIKLVIDVIGSAAPFVRLPRVLRVAADGAAQVTKELVPEVTVHNFDSVMDSVGTKLVVLDMYTQWCGPCKLIAPKIEALAEEYPDVVFLRLDCNQENKPLAKQLGVKVVPTFKFFKQKEIIAEVSGAKYDAIVAEIKKLR